MKTDPRLVTRNCILARGWSTDWDCRAAVVLLRPSLAHLNRRWLPCFVLDLPHCACVQWRAWATATRSA